MILQKTQTIIGVDPGSRVTGFGIINSDGRKSKYLASGCLRLGNISFPERLQKIFHELTAVIDLHQPEVAAIEQVFMRENASSALKLGQARGAAIVALVNSGMTVAEYAPRAIKQAVVGYGAASKDQVQHMVKSLLGIQGELQEDASDALAIALCHAHTML